MSFEARSAPNYPPPPILQDETYQARMAHRSLRESFRSSFQPNLIPDQQQEPPSTPSGSITSSIRSVRRNNTLDTSYGSGSIVREGVARVRSHSDGRMHHAIPIIVSDDVVSGTKRDGWMSPVRRFFCLLVTFDFLFSGLLWIITVIVTGKDIKAALQQQVLHYTFQTSMFDCVVVAFARFLIGILFYALLDVSHWSPVALTTVGTTVFAGAKVFKYDRMRIGTDTFDIMLILLSFILSWGELWFLDFRVLPLEMKAREIMEHFDDERTPLLVNAERGMLQRYVDGSLWDGSVANFYSPLESPEDSGDEIEEVTFVTVPKKFKRKTPLTAKESEYRKQAEESLQTAWKLLNSSDWKLEKSNSSSGDTVHSKIVRGKKLFKLTGIVNLPPKLLLEELFYKIESVPTWNPTLTECKTIQPIDSHTDVSYQVCAESAGGAVSIRDFVNLRHWKTFGEGIYFSSAVSIQHPGMPTQPKRVRGENGPGGFAMKALADDNNQCQFQFLLDTDLKGWIPQYIIDSALSTVQMEYIGYIRKYAASLHESGRVRDYIAQQEMFQRRSAITNRL